MFTDCMHIQVPMLRTPPPQAAVHWQDDAAGFLEHSSTILHDVCMHDACLRNGLPGCVPCKLVTNSMHEV